MEKDDKEALKWLRKAANGGIEHSLFALGVRYEKGIGVSASNQKAIKYYIKAAKKGSIKAKLRLDEMGISVD